MKPNVMNPRGRAGGRAATAQQAVFQMKQRVLLSLNKLADRDTHQIAAEELEKTAEGLPPEMIAPFLSCITDTDSEQKSAVRKECVRLMGALARSHRGLLAPHFPRIVASIVKRLKDSDSVVRDACVEACGVLASSVRKCRGIGGDGEGDGGGAFVALVRPLFEALGEQSRYIQAGSALCLAKVIDETRDFPLAFLPQMLARIVKLLKNPHFMAKPAVIELIRSIVQAGGAATEHALSTALFGLLDSLKDSDWTTRKGASVALASIAISSGCLLGSFKTTCIRSLECCKFDKVKPVRDAVIHAIHSWKALPGPDSPEPSEAGSSTKENFCPDYDDTASISDAGSREASFRKVAPLSAANGNSFNSIKRRGPLSGRKATGGNAGRQHGQLNDWRIEISLPKGCVMPLADTEEKGSGPSCPKNDVERTKSDASDRDYKGDYKPMDGKPQCSSVTDVASRSCETKRVTTVHECIEDSDLDNKTGVTDGLLLEEIDSGCLRKERKSVDSTVTDLTSDNSHGCCLHAVNELTLIKKQLQDIETKQANLLDLLQILIGNSMGDLSGLKSKVHDLECAVDNIRYCVTQSESHSSTRNSKALKIQSVSSSPRLSTSTPRSSVETNYKPPPFAYVRNENISSKSRTSISLNEGNPVATGALSCSGRSTQRSQSNQARDVKAQHSVSVANDFLCPVSSPTPYGFSKQIQEFLIVGDVESAYVEALGMGDDCYVIDLMARTGPVLERLSHETANEVLRALATVFLDQKVNLALPWLQQVVDLSTTQEPGHLFLSARAQREFLAAIMEVATKRSINPLERISISKLAIKLQQVCGEAQCRRVPPPRGSRGSRNVINNSAGN